MIHYEQYNQEVHMIYLLNTTGLTSGGKSTVHTYTQTVHRTTHLTTEQQKQRN